MSIDDKLQNIQKMSDMFSAQMNEVTDQIKDFQDKLGRLFIPFEVKFNMSETEGVKWNCAKKQFDYFKVVVNGRNTSMQKMGNILSAKMDSRKRFVACFDEILEIISEKYATHETTFESSSYIEDEDEFDNESEEVIEMPVDKVDNQIFSRKTPPKTVREQFKLQAKQMTEDKRASGCDMRISTALNLLSKQAGYKDWNTCSAMLRRLEATQNLKPKQSEPEDDNESFGNR